ncbi:MAG: tetratricopeptide repeat protein [Kofleriaceae bacterium]
MTSEHDTSRRSRRWPRLRALARGLAAVPAMGALALVTASSTTVRADTWSDAATELGRYEAELGALSQITAPTPATLDHTPPTTRLIEAQVAFGVGDYDTASVLLYDVVSQGGGAAVDAGLYYLAEALYQKNDLGGARTYFARVVDESGSASRYYQASLERLVEIAIALDDTSTVAPRLTALAQLAGGVGRPSATYVRAKYAFAQQDYPGALALFAEVPRGSAYEFQSAYYAATVRVAKGELAEATTAFAELIQRTPTRVADRRVIELAQLALGRLHYEQDQPGRAISSYLMIDRKSDLFDDALYEVAWVYVKSKQFDRALRMLELLSLVDPSSEKLPMVQILEGNLRIRKAQLLRARMVEGVPSKDGTPAEEYAKAAAVFARAHDTYAEPHDALDAVLAGKPWPPAAAAPTPVVDGDAPADAAVAPAAVAPALVYEPSDYLDVITGRESKTFAVDAELPTVAVAWLREDPEVARVMRVEEDLGDVQDSVFEALDTIERLEVSMSITNKVGRFPALAKTRDRVVAMQAALLGLELRIVDEEARAYAASGAPDPAIDALIAERRAASAAVAALPDEERAFSARIATAKNDYDQLERTASQVQVALDAMAAQRAALLTYSMQADPPLDEFRQAQLDQGLAALDAEMGPMRAELEAVRREIELGRDEAAARDEFTRHQREVRARARAAIGAEHQALRARAGLALPASLDALMARSNVLEDRLAALTAELERTADAALANVRAEVAANKTDLLALRREFIELEAESRALGGEVVEGAMVATRARLYDVVVRADVGSVDVAWSQKEDVDADLKSLNVGKQRELRQLRDEFKELIEEDKAIKAAAAAAAAATPPPPPPSTDPAAAGAGGTP